MVASASRALRSFWARPRAAARSPREALRVALRLAWISDESFWLRMLDDRNRTSHTYNEAVAEEIFSRLATYAAALDTLRHRLGSAIS